MVRECGLVVFTLLLVVVALTRTDIQAQLKISLAVKINEVSNFKVQASPQGLMVGRQGFVTQVKRKIRSLSFRGIWWKKHK